MRAQLLVRRRLHLSDNEFAEIVIWRVPQPVRGSGHEFKYRLAHVIDGVCALRFDNESGKGDHIHRGGAESPYTFRGPEQLLDDFFAEIDGGGK